MTMDRQLLTNLIAAESPALWKLTQELWKRPETGYEEHFAVAAVKKFLSARGFEVTNPYCGLDTAFRAEAGSGTPVFAVAAEYDALKGLGHGCGHNLICGAALAAFCALAQYLKTRSVNGKVVLLGTPAEETDGGKVKMLARGCLHGVDAAMMVHPSTQTQADPASLALFSYRVAFHGKAAHAGGDPEDGVNALDAVMLLFAGVNAYRQQLPEDARIHGIVISGGDAPNIIPDYAACTFYLRAATMKWIKKIEHRFKDIVRGASLMTGATAEIAPLYQPDYPRKPNAALNREYIAAAKRAGLAPVEVKSPGRGSSDFGNFSQTVPGIHPYFAISDHAVLSHSVEFREAAGAPLGFDNAMKAATAMAETVLRFLADASFRAEVQREFRKKR